MYMYMLHVFWDFLKGASRFSIFNTSIAIMSQHLLPDIISVEIIHLTYMRSQLFDVTRTPLIIVKVAFYDVCMFFAWNSHWKYCFPNNRNAIFISITVYYYRNYNACTTKQVIYYTKQ